jgi:predicted nuclease of restriction endonuclease-like (RecB) superfamily
MAGRPTDLPAGYAAFLVSLKERIRNAQQRAALSVNRELVLLYWSIGRDILSRQAAAGWGSKVIDRLSADLRHALPELQGLSTRNLKYMRALAEAYPDEAFVQQVVAQIPWGHNVRLLDAVKEPAEREWYLRQTIQHGWSRNVLVHQIGTGLFRRQGQALSNFDRALPEPESELARQILKDPYNFDFLSLGAEAKERDLEAALLTHVRRFLLEMDSGFALVGNQYPLVVSGEEYRVDLLFYHLKLRAFVVVDLKVEAFKPEFAGKMGFYLSAVDDLLRHPQDGPSIGLVLCRSRDRVVVEYTLRDTTKPIGVAEYRLADALPDAVKGSLPSVAELEAELAAADGPDDTPT